MNSKREEEVLLSDAAQMQRELEKDAGTTSIRLSVQLGIERGQRGDRQRFWNKSRSLGFAAAIIVAALLFIIPFLPRASQPAAPAPKVNWGALQVFKDNVLYEMDVPTFESAIRNNYIQLVNQTVESGGYSITLNAITADENKIMYLYTATTDDKQEIYSINSAKMKDSATNRYLNATSQVGGNVEVPEQQRNHVYYGRGVVELDRTQPFPQQLEAEFRIASVNPGKMDAPRTGTIMSEMHYSPVLKIGFTLDPKFMAYKTQIVQPNRSFTLSGHEVVISKVELSPLVIKATIALKNPSENSRQIRSAIFEEFFSKEILAEVHDKTISLSTISGGGSEEGYDYLFASNWLDHPESLIMAIKTGAKNNQTELKLDIYKRGK
ncbi:DUF4179 domain-containing protein [Paenibacillus sp. HW567]|uniref:DUF4179 domain-containing protein n=1 Tax=Paenibacillus sp. HW567 TaxID=1034769 RepID=UPI00035E12CB|nr:DUF4179 domain-containing protein [Paenibacillus sp. HW567]